MEAIQGELASYFERAGTWKPLSEATGISNTQLRRYLAGAPDAKVLRRTVERIRRGLAEVADAALAHAA